MQWFEFLIDPAVANRKVRAGNRTWPSAKCAKYPEIGDSYLRPTCYRNAGVSVQNPLRPQCTSDGRSSSDQHRNGVCSKAKSVLYTHDSTHARANMVANNLPLQVRWSGIGVFPTAGGLPIMVDDQMIGAIGVGGSNVDEECAYAALTSVVGPQPALAPKLPPAPPRP